MRTAIRNGNLLDTARMEFLGEQTILIEDDRIVAVGEEPPGALDLNIDARGAYILPGFIDAHVHFRLATMDFRKLAAWTEVEFGIAMALDVEEISRLPR